MNFEKTEVPVAASLREGADLRLKVAGQYARQIVEARHAFCQRSSGYRKPPG